VKSTRLDRSIPDARRPERHLVVGIAATTLFDLREADAFFRAQMAAEPATALQAYRQHMLEREQDPLADGTAMPLVGHRCAWRS